MAVVHNNKNHAHDAPCEAAVWRGQLRLIEWRVHLPKPSGHAKQKPMRGKREFYVVGA